jgi:hypothetical protein
MLNASLRKSVFKIVKSVWITVQRSSNLFIKVSPALNFEERIARSGGQVSSSINRN